MLPFLSASTGGVDEGQLDASSTSLTTVNLLGLGAFLSRLQATAVRALVTLYMPLAQFQHVPGGA
jgi:hypothetical protein